MAASPIALELAAFLDSAPGRALEVPSDDVRAIAERFLTACYEDLGKAPRHLDGHDVHEVVGHLLPRRFSPGEALVESAPEVLAAYVEHLETAQVVSQSFELRHALDGALAELVEAVRTGRSAHHHVPKRQDPFVHGAPKLGRNDPCSCGSGKKYKKCHGKGA